MKGNHFDLAALKAKNYVDAPRTHVTKAYQILTGDESVEGLDLEYMREQLQKMNTLEAIAEKAPAAVVPEKQQGIGRIPNLTPTGEWEGRMRLVTIHKANPDSIEEAISIGWEGCRWIVRYDEQLKMPWPYWEALKNAVTRDESSDKAVKWEKDASTGQLMKVINRIDKPRYSYTDHGDVPGTESLPENYIEFFRGAARRTGVFKDAKPAMLLLIYEKLFDGQPVDKNHQLVQLDHTTLRVRISQRLGTEFVSILNNEIYEAA